MTNSRIPCNSINCTGAILPQTAADTGGYCMPCFKQNKRNEEAEYIKKNKINVNLFENLKCPLEIIQVFHKPIQHDPLICYETYPYSISTCYKVLNNKQISDLVVYLTNLYKTQKENEAKEIATCLFAFTKADLTPLLEEMIGFEDYKPAFLFKGSDIGIIKNLLEKFFINEDIQSDLFRCIAWFIETGSMIDDKVYNDLKGIRDKYRRTAFRVKSEVKILRKDGFKKSILGNINIGAKAETWPKYGEVSLNPVLQLAVSDLPYVPIELQEIDYICIYIHPDDAGALLERSDALIIRTYRNEDLVILKAPESIEQEASSKLLQFEQVYEYPCDYLYPSPFQYLQYLSSKSLYVKSKNEYDWDKDFIDNSAKNMFRDAVRIMGWPQWTQWGGSYHDSEFILQIESYGLWEYGDNSMLYIFRNKTTKEFWGFIEMS